MKNLLNTPNYFVKLIIISLIIFSSQGTAFAQYYWVDGSGDWTDYANHWATTSGGNTFHTSLPTSTDDVFFDANSFLQAGHVVTVNTAQANCNSMDWTGVANNPGFESSAPDILNIYGSLTLSANMTCNLRFIEMESNTGGNTITTSGISLGSNSILKLQGTGTWTLQDVLTVNSFQIYQGIFNTNNNTINCTLFFTLNGNLQKTLNLGSSTITTNVWRTIGSNNTLNMGTSTIITDSFFGDDSGSGPYTYYNLEIKAGGLIYGTSNFNRITLESASFGISEVEVQSGRTTTAQEFVISGNVHFPLYLNSSSSGSEATFNQTSGTVNGSYIIMQDIHASGGATFNVNPGEDNGNNTGWNFTPIVSLLYYWVGNGGVWSDVSHWATTSGGNTMHTDRPSQFDQVYFDANSFTVPSQNVTVDTTASCKSIDFTGVTNNPFFTTPFAFPFRVYGSAIFSDDMDHTIYSLRLQGPTTGNFVRPSIQGTIQNFGLYGTGDWTLTGDLTCGNVSHVYGRFNTNGYQVNASFTFGQSGFNNIDLVLGSSQINATDFRLNSTNISLDAGTSIIRITRDFYGKGFDFYKLTLAGTNKVLDQNTFEILEAAAGAAVSFEEGDTQFVNQSIILNGNSNDPINLSSTLNGSAAALSLGTGTVNGTFLILQDIDATGGATFNATESVDNGNNTGWNITALIPLDYYWVGGTGNWSDFANHWATTSGGNAFHNRVPGVLDDVYFDGNSFTAVSQVVTIDSPAVNFNNMSWAGVTNFPLLSGIVKTMNIYGSLTLSSGMDINVRDFYFFSDSIEVVTIGNGMNPGDNSRFHFNGSGEWNLQDSLRVREINLTNGTFNTNDNFIHVDFRLNFKDNDNKVLNLGNSTIFTRGMQWNSSTGDNLNLNGSNSHIKFSGSFSPDRIGSNVNVSLGNLSAVKGDFFDNARISNSLTIDTLTFEAGKTIGLTSGITLTVNQLIAVGTSINPISISTVQVGQISTINQASGAVNGQYLELKDQAATGGATFNAFSSVNLGNVSGWVFGTQAQSINFSSIPDKIPSDAPFTVTATASSSLPVSFSILSGPATVLGNTITLTGLPGTVEVQATQAGDVDYSPAPAITNTFTVNMLSQTINFPPIPDKLITDVPFTISATTSSSLPVTFSIILGPATVQGNTITLAGTIGIVQVEANQAGNIDYAAIADTLIFEVKNLIGIESLQNNTIGKLWPNPVQEILNIELISPTKVLNYRIQDVTGKEVLNGTLNSNQLNFIELDLGLLNNGLYLIQFITEEGQFNSKFIKTN